MFFTEVKHPKCSKFFTNITNAFQFIMLFTLCLFLFSIFGVLERNVLVVAFFIITLISLIYWSYFRKNFNTCKLNKSNEPSNESTPSASSP